MTRWRKDQSLFDFITLVVVAGIFAYVLWRRVQ